MYPKIINAVVKDDYQLLITFSNNVIKRIDMQKKLNEDRFYELKNIALFRNLHIDQGGYGISWNEEIDMSEYEAWNDGVEVS